MNFIVTAISIRSMMTLSSKPITGIKSGIKSIGDKAYPITIPAKIFAIIGVSFFFKAINIAGISVFSFFALFF